MSETTENTINIEDVVNLPLDVKEQEKAKAEKSPPIEEGKFYRRFGFRSF